MDELLVSVNCITYNHEKYIADTIEGFLMQKTNFRYEILIHDDASTDNTQEIIKAYQKRYPNIIKPIFQKENQLSKGVSKISYSFNHTRAKGKFIAMCEGDDYWTDPFKLQKQVEIFEENPNISAVFHKVERVMPNKKRTGFFFHPINLKPNSIYTMKDIIEFNGKVIHLSSLMYKKELLDSPPNFFFDCLVGDLPMMLILANQGDFYYINDNMSSYRQGVPNGAVQRLFKDKSNFTKTKKNIISIYKEFNNYTNGNYKDILDKIQKEIQFDILRSERDLAALKTKKFGDLYNNLSNKEKAILYLDYYLPVLSTILKKMKRIIRV